MLWNLILHSNVDRKEAMAMDRLVAKLPTCKLLIAEWDQLQDFITKHDASSMLFNCHCLFVARQYDEHTSLWVRLYFTHTSHVLACAACRAKSAVPSRAASGHRQGEGPCLDSMHTPLSVVPFPRPCKHSMCVADK